MTGPWLRRVLHAATASVLLVAEVVPRHQFRLIVWVIALLTILVDATRLRAPGLRRSLDRLLPVFRAGEQRRPSGAVWLWLGYAVAVLAPPAAACAGILVAALADPVAAAVGEGFRGPTRKSVEGSVAGLFVAATILVALRLPWLVVLAGAVVAALLERWPGPFDDNLLVAPGVAATTAMLL